jgi:hypothetical protein|tara:strand:- start:1108 stop:1293 length:186 start_codon:yes stop_codon:yes gene_type:complete
MKKYLSDKEISLLQNRTKLDYEDLDKVVEYLEERNLEVTISMIIETVAILWGFDFLFNDSD